LFRNARETTNRYTEVPLGKNNLTVIGKEVATILGKNRPETYCRKCWPTPDAKILLVTRVGNNLEIEYT
jgi:hypothetical protein